LGWEVFAVGIIVFSSLLFGFLGLNYKFPKGFRMMFVFMSFLLIIVAINQARTITEDATGNTELDRLISMTHASLIWFFLTFTAIFLTLEMVAMFGWFSAKKKASGNT